MAKLSLAISCDKSRQQASCHAPWFDDDYTTFDTGKVCDHAGDFGGFSRASWRNYQRIVALCNCRNSIFLKCIHHEFRFFGYSNTF